MCKLSFITIASLVLAAGSDLASAQIDTAQIDTAQIDTAQIDTAQIDTAQKSLAQKNTAQESTAQKAAPEVAESSLGETRNVHSCGNVFLAGQPTRDDFQTIKEKGIQRVITLREPGEVDWDEGAAVREAGLEFVKIPFRSPDSLTEEVFDKVRGLLKQSDSKPAMLHCGSANRVGAVWLVYRVLDQGVPIEKAVEEAKTVGLRMPEYEQKARDYIKKNSKPSGDQQSVRPGINDNFLAGDLVIDEWIQRFEVESREVYAARDNVLEATEVESGCHVADVGAGTGLYSRLFSSAVGADGQVYAVDISPRFIDHLSKQVEDVKLTNVTPVLCQADSVNLPPQSIDLAFICDSYHHFEYPQATLASIHRALRPDGSLVVIDFERIPGKSREWLLNHVRAGKQEFRAEIEAAEFQFVEEVSIDGFAENYFLRFRKQ